MTFLTFLLYFLAVDVVLSLVVFGVLFIFKRPLLNLMRIRLTNLLTVDSDLNEESCCGCYEDEYEDVSEMKPAMREAMDREFGYPNE